MTAHRLGYSILGAATLAGVLAAAQVALPSSPQRHRVAAPSEALFPVVDMPTGERLVIVAEGDGFFGRRDADPFKDWPFMPFEVDVRKTLAMERNRWEPTTFYLRAGRGLQLFATRSFDGKVAHFKTDPATGERGYVYTGDGDLTIWAGAPLRRELQDLGNLGAFTGEATRR